MTATCSKCGKVCASEKGLRQHYTAKHSRFRCDPCKRRFPDQSALDAHNEAKHGDEQNEADRAVRRWRGGGGAPRRLVPVAQEIQGGAA